MKPGDSVWLNQGKTQPPKKVTVVSIDGNM